MSPYDAANEERIVSNLTGNTFLVYWQLLKRKSRPMGPRAIQRALGFSSPGTATYHLEKLREMDLLRKNRYGEYYVHRMVKIGLISAFVFIGDRAFPKSFFYATATTLMMLFSLSLFYEQISPIVFIALLPGIVASIIFWYETTKLLQQRPH